jgi:hypothetical protein
MARRCGVGVALPLGLYALADRDIVDLPAALRGAPPGGRIDRVFQVDVADLLVEKTVVETP